MLGRQRTPEAIGELGAGLVDEDELLRCLASLSLQGIGGGTVIAALQAFIDQSRRHPRVGRRRGSSRS